MDFVAASVEASATPRAKLAKRPRRRVRATGRKTKVRFRLSATGAKATFECRVDAKDLRPCGRRKTARLTPGPHRFRYRAFGQGGRPSKTESYRFRVVE
jgi:hypothetical protein